MPLKLQVVKKDDEGEPADYLFEQDRITIGRGSSNDLTLPDQKVSTEHAEIRAEDGEYLLVDRDSKNKTYVDGRRVGEEEPYTLRSGDVFQVGDFMIEFAPLFMPSSEQTVFDEDSKGVNPFERYTRQLTAALEGLVETYKFAPSEQRDDAIAQAMRNHLDAGIGDEEPVRHIVNELGGGDGAADADDTAAREAEMSEVLKTVLRGVVRMISIPDHFWREFTGRTLEHPPEKQFLYDADAEDLREHLLSDDLSEEERKERLQDLSDAVESLVAHNMAMLAGYKKATMAGSKELLQQVNPIDAVEEAEEQSSGMVGSFFGGAGKSELERLEERWRELYHGEWGKLENDLFRPTYVDAYVDRMAQTWDLDRAEILSEEDNA